MKKPVNGVSGAGAQGGHQGGASELIAFTKVRSPQSFGSHAAANQYALFDTGRASNRGVHFNQLNSTTSQDSNRVRKLITFE